ncbi:unnamed protein product [Rotaria magnacalcarata]|uniref:Uncharacterized protein n=1 Tax=Rotaria magnacalcarata TaxID=392030 RepID=A0A816RNR1_9BILA|nr:unnamed protein product [Rotaria magnacalcarata]CAF1636158.1 unnamed protein product [Rotaria magnacalcarata]CAF2072488.1 unnamed protein product [Rotaria magnacalcarata]CAF3973892.1 unnamed protein product [Rotaria magnacalcarata]CAF3996739.1 unnamed protein product [Rotaria magnacalcarata]
MYLNKHNCTDEVGILFEIIADPKLPGGVRPFANITTFSQFPEEREVLFMAGSIFRVTDVIIANPFSTVKMELCSENDNHLKTIFESLRLEYGGEQAGKDKEASLNSLGIVLFNMNRYDTANRFFRRIYNESSADDPNRARYCMNIGNVALHTGRYRESAEWYDRALKFCESQKFIDHPIQANIHLVRGNLYQKQHRRRQALDSYNKALTIYRKNFGENHPRIGTCYANMAGLFERRKYYRTALEYHERALNVAEQTLPTAHPGLIPYHIGFADLLLDLRHRDLHRALNHAEKALDIAKQSMPPEHPGILCVYATLGRVYESMKDFEHSRFWYNKVYALRHLKTADGHIQRKWNTRKDFICIRCHRSMWIYQSFEWMKDTKLNCFIFHEFGSFIMNIVRYCCHY